MQAFLNAVAAELCSVTWLECMICREGMDVRAYFAGRIERSLDGGVDMVNCPHCGSALFGGEAYFSGPATGSLDIEDTDIFFHATVQQNWLTGVKASQSPVHAGTALAALDRALALVQQKPQPVFAVHFLEVLPTAVKRWSVDDMGEDWDGVDLSPEEVVPYRNMFEAAGTVSIIAGSESFAAVRSENTDLRALRSSLFA